MVLSATPTLVSEEHLAAYERDGFFLLENVLSSDDLNILRSEVALNIAAIDAEMDAKGVERLGINSKNSRYFVNALKTNPESPVTRFIFGDLMAGITRAILGENVYLFYEQYVVKAAERGESFSWHQDSGYVGHANHKPYLTCWVTLDDVNEQNGTVYMLPYEKAGTKNYVAHDYNAQNGDKTGYHGDEIGVPIIAPAGSIACFSSTCFHRSGANQTDKMRRIYLPQYSSEPILVEDGSRLFNLATPFWENGTRVRFE